MSYINQKLQRVTRGQPCPVCGKGDWCGFNRRIAICMRVASPYPAKNGGWTHKLTANPGYNKPPPTLKSTLVADIARREQVYRAFLSLLSLNAKHHQELTVNRGFTPEAINRIGFKSLAGVKPWQITKQLTDMGYDLTGIPGFYKARDTKNRGYCYWNFNYLPGFVFPILDLSDRIQALQLRLDHPETGGAKYRLFSSGTRQSGAGSGTPVHVARPQILTDQRIWITEGPLKAMALSYQIGAVVLGAVSAATWRTLMPVLNAFPGQEIVEAFDRDRYVNLSVKRNCSDLRKVLRSTGRQAVGALWDHRFKGADDAALAGCGFTFKKIN